MNRRSFLSRSAAGLGAIAVSGILPAMAEGQPASSIVKIRPLPGSPLATLPANFVGLGYEMASVAPLGLLSVHNERYLQLVRNLGPVGVLRLGGIVSDFTHYEPNGPIMAESKNTVITRASLEQLSAFLKRTGWTAIWSVNFGKGTLPEAIEETRAVSSILGSSLYAIEIGNEVENYGRGEHPLRTSPYGYATFRKEFDTWRKGILNAVPGVRFAAPDTAASVDWVENMANDARGEVQLLTTHYYRNNQLRGSAGQLATPDPNLQAKLERLQLISHRSGIPWRMCETNSFSGGGRPGVSDTMLGALWTLDYMLLLAKYGCAGVNIETGVNQLGFVSCYSPIQDDGKANNTAGVPYYGMLAFVTATANSKEVLPVHIDNPLSLNVTAYALGAGGKPRAVVVINRDSTQTADIDIADLKMGKAHVLRLAAPSGSAKTGVTFAGSSVNADGHWSPSAHEITGNGKVLTPPMSAALLMST